MHALSVHRKIIWNRLRVIFDKYVFISLIEGSVAQKRGLQFIFSSVIFSVADNNLACIGTFLARITET